LLLTTIAVAGVLLLICASSSNPIPNSEVIQRQKDRQFVLGCIPGEGPCPG
jgi:hypothetical protein